MLTSMNTRLRNIEANGLRFAYLETGPANGPLVLCVHGFPDCAHTWRHLTPELVEAGYRVVAPWQRGYAPTSVPADGQYQGGALAADLIALHEALGGDGEAVLIGHDFGATAAYGAAAYAPNRWRKVVTIAIPPAGAMAEKIMSYDQLRRSWYAYFFQNPMADRIVAADGLAFIDRFWKDWSPDYDAADDLVEAKAAIKAPEHLAAAIAYYRSMFGAIAQDEKLAQIQKAVAQSTPQPALYLHGVDDECMGIELAENAERFFPAAGSRVLRIEDAGHFVHLERPDVVNGAITDFLAEKA